jgi:hypothetical protein
MYNGMKIYNDMRRLNGFEAIINLVFRRSVMILVLFWRPLEKKNPPKFGGANPLLGSGMLLNISSHWHNLHFICICVFRKTFKNSIRISMQSSAFAMIDERY